LKILKKSEEAANKWIQEFLNELQQIEDFYLMKFEENIRKFIELQV
jgi:hypothetical protein